jgi:DNA-binding NtrC family response regulator
LKVLEIHLPPLRERKGDIPLLAEHLMAKIGEDLHKRAHGLTPEAMNRLTSYNWPGNVRELEHALTRAVVLCRGGVVDAGHLPIGGTEPLGAPDGSTETQGDTLAAVEAAHVQRILSRTGGVKRQAARILGISRTRLDRLIERHRLTVP